MVNREKRYTLILTTLVGTLTVFFVGWSYFLLSRTHELTDVAEIAKHQQNSHGLYGTAIHETFFSYKTAIYQARRPDVVALGSSRVMLFRAPYFRRSFANLGGTMQNLHEGWATWEHLKKAGVPRQIILGIEFWWFAPNRPQREVFPEHELRGTEIYPAIKMPLIWIRDGRFSPRQFFSLPWTALDFPTYGVKALIDQTGFRDDGSMSYLGIATQVEKLGGNSFDQIHKRIENGENGYEFGENYDVKQFKLFGDLIADMRLHGVQILTFFPPLAPSVYERLVEKVDKYQYIERLRRDIPKVSPFHLDFLDPASLSSSQCEFVDGQHGGETTYLRVLDKFYKAGDSLVKLELNFSEIEVGVRRYGNRIMAFDHTERVYRQSDIHGLGCL